MPTRSPTGREVSTLDTVVIICTVTHDDASRVVLSGRQRRHTDGREHPHWPTARRPAPVRAGHRRAPGAGGGGGRVDDVAAGRVVRGGAGPAAGRPPGGGL